MQLFILCSLIKETSQREMIQVVNALILVNFNFNGKLMRKQNVLIRLYQCDMNEVKEYFQKKK